MNIEQSKFSSFFQSDKKKSLFILFTIFVVICAYLIQTYVFLSNLSSNSKDIHYALIENSLSILFLGIYITIPQFIAFKISEKYRKYSYSKSGNKLLSLISSISHYFIWCILIFVLSNIILISIFDLFDNAELLAYTIASFVPYLFIIWLISIIFGIISLIVNANQSEIVVIEGKIPVRIYLSFSTSIFFALVLLFLVYIFTIGNLVFR